MGDNGMRNTAANMGYTTMRGAVLRMTGNKKQKDLQHENYTPTNFTIIHLQYFLRSMWHK